MKYFAAACIVIFTLLLPFLPVNLLGYPVVTGGYYSAAILLGKVDQTDLAQDMYGFRALIERREPYRPIGDIFPEIGASGRYVEHPSTHPPTAFLFTAPIAYASWPVASILWGWSMLAAILFSLQLSGFRWKDAALITALLLYWPPAALSLGQLTPIWLLGAAAAYHYRNARPLNSGAWLAAAALTKYFPALMLAPFLLRRQWKLAVSFAIVFCTATLICIGTFPRYLQVNRANSIEMITRSDNSSLLWLAYHWLGWAGVGLLVAGILGLIVANRRAVFATGGDVSIRSWWVYLFLSVFLLPVVWVYSLLPILPILLLSVKDSRTARILALSAVSITTIMPFWNEISVPFIAVAMLMTGGILCLPHPTPPIQTVENV